jgi:hypothetical protein
LYLAHTEITSGCCYLILPLHNDSSKLQQKTTNLLKKTGHIAARDNDIMDIIKFMRQRLFKLLLSVIPFYPLGYWKGRHLDSFWTYIYFQSSPIFQLLVTRQCCPQVPGYIQYETYINIQYFIREEILARPITCSPNLDIIFCISCSWHHLNNDSCFLFLDKIILGFFCMICLLQLINVVLWYTNTNTNYGQMRGNKLLCWL